MIKRELIGGFSTFATMAYILVVNATILSDAGMDFGAVMVATILVTAFSTLLMGGLTRFPIAIAPGMGVSGYIAYSLIPLQGKTWPESLAAVFIVGFLLLALNALRIREKLLHAVPSALRMGITGGIGLFLIFVGFKHVGLITLGRHGWIELGQWSFLPLALTLGGVGLIALLERFKVRSAFILVILLSWALALAFGLTSFEGVVSLPPSLLPTFLKMDLSSFWDRSFWSILFSIFLITLLDSSAALMTLAKQADLLDEKGKILKVHRALYPDAIGTILGGMLGTGSLAIHLESAAGIRAGGKTGIVAYVVAGCFLASLFFYPILVTIPPFAPAAVLIVLGFLMFKEVFQLSWKKLDEATAVLMILLIMPLTMSIYNGFFYGFVSYCFLKLISGKIKEVPVFCSVVALVLLVHRFFI